MTNLGRAAGAGIAAPLQTLDKFIVGECSVYVK
jgi:hypothetical protein